MPRSTTTLQVLVAYPDDIVEERAILDVVVEELNRTWSRNLGVEIELIDWKTHSYPGFGTDAQAVINDEIGNEYDIFIGIVWTRLGTPTLRAESGTVEEFNRALERFRENPTQLRIMFYFKNAPPVSLKDLDLDQIASIRKLRERIGQEGGLYAEFDNPGEFASYVRMHLSRLVQDWGKGWGVADPQTEETQKEPSQDLPQAAEDEEEGFLDLIERGQESFETLNEILGRMNADMDTYKKRMEERTAEINMLAKSADIKQRKRLINSTAEVLNQYARMLEAVVPGFSTSYAIGIDAVARAASIWNEDLEDLNEGEDHVATTHEQVRTLKSVLTDSCDSMVSWRASVDRVPRMTSIFNHSRKRLSLALQRLVNEMQKAISLTSEAEKELERILERRELQKHSS